MSKLSEYLGQHLSGEVSSNSAVCDYFSSDGSALKYKPKLVIYPRTIDDVRKLARFSWRLAEKGLKLPITARGYGADNTSSATGTGATIVFPAHLQKVLELDTKLKKIRVQPGLNVRTLQEIVATHGLYLPIYPTNLKYATVGGSIANNVTGPKGLCYGSMRNFVDRVEVVLSNGEVIQTGRISKREVNTKKGLQTLEGEIYREIDALIEANEGVIAEYASSNLPDNMGYHLSSIKNKDGSIDLTPLFVGSQGTLGIIVQAIINLIPRQNMKSLLVSALPNLDNFADLVEAIGALRPTEFEFIDGSTLKYIEKQNGVMPLNTLIDTEPEGVFVIEFGDGEGQKSKSAKQALKILGEFGAVSEIAESQSDQEDVWGVRFASGALVNDFTDGRQPIQFADAVVPINKIGIFRDRLESLIESRKIDGYITGRVGTGNLSVTALLDLGRLNGRQAVFAFGRDYYKLVASLGGSIAGDSGDGRLRIEASQEFYGERMAELFAKIKDVFDPKGIFNPGVIVPDEKPDLVTHLNGDREIRFADYRPRV